MGNEANPVENVESGCANRAVGGINSTDSTPYASGNAANQAGSFFSLPEATTFDEQLSKLEDRGLIIHDKAFAIGKLQNLNYYRLRGYWLTFERNGKFVEGTTFNDIWEVYQLDHELRDWLWQAIAPIEIKLRSQFAYHFAHSCGPDGYLNKENYLSEEKFLKALTNYERECDRAYDQGVPCVVHNKDKYGKLPIWAAVETMSLGTLSMLYGNLDPSIGKEESGVSVAMAIAYSFGSRPKQLKSWAYHLTTVRNIVAHHDRLYNRIMNIQPYMLKRDKKYASRKQFPTLLTIKRIYEMSWKEDWRMMGGNLMSCFDRHPSVDLAPMGFPGDWKRILNLL